MIYFDASYLVRLYYQDPGAEQVRSLAATDHIACASLGEAEMMAAFHRKLREEAIKPAAYSALVGQVETHIKAGAFSGSRRIGKFSRESVTSIGICPRRCSCAEPTRSISELPLWQVSVSSTRMMHAFSQPPSTSEWKA